MSLLSSIKTKIIFPTRGEPVCFAARIACCPILDNSKKLEQYDFWKYKNRFPEKAYGSFVYRLGHEILNLKRRVRFP